MRSLPSLPAVNAPLRAKHLSLDFTGVRVPSLKVPPIELLVDVEAIETTHARLLTLEKTIDTATADLERAYDYGPECAAPTESAIATANEIAKRLARIGIERLGEVIPMPDIGPTMAGGVDLHWRTASAELLIGVPSQVGGSISFYGDTPTGETIKGRIPVTGGGDFLAVWLLQRT